MLCWKWIGVPLIVLLGIRSAGLSQVVQTAHPLADFQRVVVEGQPVPSVDMAAKDLADYASRVSGTKIQILPLSQYKPELPGRSFFVGEKAAEVALGKSPGPWKREEYLIKSIPTGLVLAGQDVAGKATNLKLAAGTQLAVYTLLDDYLGVKWVWPGSTGEHVPSVRDAVVPTLDIRTVPVNAIRSVSAGYGTYKPTSVRVDYAVWSRRTRQGWPMSAWFGHSWFYAFELRGGKEKSQYFQKHPDWFALVNGERRPPQMCTSHPEVINRMVEFVLADKSDITSISPSDGYGFCECNEETKSAAHKAANLPSCTALDIPGLMSADGKNPLISDRIMTYANTIARKVRERDPNKGVGMFAYTFYNRAPQNIKQLEPNLYLSFVFQSQAFLDPIAHHEWLENIEGWQKLGAKMIVREGWGNHYLLDLPFPIEKHITSSLKEANHLGFVGAYGEGSGAFATQGPNMWAVVRSMWDPNGDGAKVMDDFYAAAYGPAAEPMKRFFGVYRDALESHWAQRRMIIPSRAVSYVNLANSWRILYTVDTVAAAEKCLREAEAMSLPREYADRVKVSRVGQDYAACMIELLGCYSRLADLGMELEFFKPADNPAPAQEGELQVILRRAYELGEKREDILLANRDLPAVDEGLYAATNDIKHRQWHKNVKDALKIDKPTRLTKALLSAGAEPAESNPGLP